MARHLVIQEQIACAEALQASDRALYRCRTRAELSDTAAIEVKAALQRHDARARLAMDFV